MHGRDRYKSSPNSAGAWQLRARLRRFLDDEVVQSVRLAMEVIYNNPITIRFYPILSVHSRNHLPKSLHGRIANSHQAKQRKRRDADGTWKKQ